MHRVQRILSILLIVVLLMLTACSTPEQTPSPTPDPTISPTITTTPTPSPTKCPTIAATPTPSPTPLQTPPALSKQETVAVLDAYMAELSDASDITYTASFEDDIYKVRILASDTTEWLYLCLNDESLSEEDRNSVLAALDSSMETMDRLSEILKALWDYYGYTECGAMVFVYFSSLPSIPFYTSADGEKLHSYLDLL